MAASLPSDVNDKIKKKLLALSENVRRNLLLAAGDVQRKFILEERDLLSILVLAIQYLQKPSPSSSSSSSPSTPPTIERKSQHQQQQQLQTPSTTTTNTTTTDDNNMGKSGGKTNNLDTSEKLRKELLKILDSTSFDSDAKSWLLLDAYNRYSNYNTLTKEQEILDKHLNRHPNVLVGGGESNVNESNDEVTNNGITDNSSDNDENSKPQTKKQTSSKPSTVASLETAPTNCQIVTKQNNTPIQIWINDALKTITSYMKNRINVMFLENLQNHACRLQNFLSSKGAFDKDNNRVIAPHNRFFLKKDSLYFKIKAVKGFQNFDLASLLACISFSKSKLFRFLQYRFKKVRAFTRNEKQCIHIFLNTCPISKRRIPCGAIRNLANA